MELNPLKYVTFTRLFNCIKILISYQLSKIFRNPIVWGEPLTFSIEPTNHCNLSCPGCLSGTGKLTRPLGVMNFNDYKKIIDQISVKSFYLQLFFQGEPYLNKFLPKMIDYAQRAKMYVSVSTNGLLINERNINFVFESAPDKIIFSIDGLDEVTYQKYRIGGSFKDSDNALNVLIDKRKKLGSSKPFIELQFLVMKQNEHQINDVVSYGKELGIDKVTVKTMQILDQSNAEDYLPKNNSYSRYELNNRELKVKGKQKNHCFALWKSSIVTWDGLVVPCCFDKNAVYKFGKLNGTPFIDVWKNKEYNSFRRKILKNRKEISICKNCTSGVKINVKEILVNAS